MMTGTADFLNDFATMSTHGATPGGGVDRQAGTDADRSVRRWFHGWLEERGFTVDYDAIGNQIGRIELVPGAPYIVAGSHLDSQPLAGRFDGAYGVLAAGHAAAAVADAVRAGEAASVFNVAVVNWFNEEGSRFTPSMMGSSVHTGRLELADALAKAARDGATVAEELGAEGRAGSGAFPETAGYAELHVEQGRSMEERELQVGFVTATWGAKKFRVTVTGAQAHTGSTRMEDRQDALYGAARVIVAAREVADRAPYRALHSSVSELDLEPNSPVTLAREVVLNLDLRSPETSVLEDAEAWLRETVVRIEEEARVRVDLELTHSWGQLAYPEEGVALARKVAEERGLRGGEVLTVAGHDSTNMKDVVPTVMLFVPSVDGVSHNEAELTSDEDMLAGVDLLTGVLTRMVERDLKA